jgi:hypothetical protein
MRCDLRRTAVRSHGCRRRRPTRARTSTCRLRLHLCPPRAASTSRSASCSPAPWTTWPPGEPTATSSFLVTFEPTGPTQMKPSHSSSSSGHYRPLLDISLSNISPSHSIYSLGYSHSAPASFPAQIVTPPSLRASYTTSLQNSFTSFALVLVPINLYIIILTNK